MLNINFIHSEDTINKSLGISKDEITKVKKVLLFSIASPYILSTKLFDSLDEAPDNLKSNSGCIELGLELLNTDKEVFYYLFNFNSIYDRIHDILIYYKKEDELLKEFKEEKESVEKTIKILMIQAQMQLFNKLFNIVEEANGDFNVFSESMDKILNQYSDQLWEE